MNINNTTLIMLCVFATSMSAMEEQTIECDYAKKKDIPSLLALIEKAAEKDSDKIVILPKKFREKSLESAIEAQRLFVARHNEEVIGIQKLFVIEDEKELSEILKDEIRCIDNEKERGGRFKLTSNFEESTFLNNFEPSAKETVTDYPVEDTYLYNGASLTDEKFRGRGINYMITSFAYKKLFNKIVDIVENGTSSALVLAFGLTKVNSGEEVNGIKGKDRTKSVLRTFIELLRSMKKDTDGVSLVHARYKAFMPAFDPESQECKPLADEHRIPGYGNIFKYHLTTIKEKNA